MNPSADGGDSQLELYKFLCATVPNSSDADSAKLPESSFLLTLVRVTNDY